MQVQWSWVEMLKAFRALGGTADNIGVGDDGALVVQDRDHPVLMRVPESLVLPLDAFELSEGELHLRDAESASRATRDFLDGYEHLCGPLFFAQATAAVAALDSLPAPVKEALSADFGMRTWFEDGNAERIERWVVERRAIRRAGEKVIVPVLENVQHGVGGLAIQFENGVRIAGPAREGVRVFHPFQDALAIFQRFGFAAAQPAAFSVPMCFDSEGVEIAIDRNMHLAERLGEVNVPQLNVVARDGLALSHLMIGHSASPRLARSVFRARMRAADLKDPDWQFDRIVQENAARFLNLLRVLEGLTGETILSLRRVARHQLEAMSWCIGAREI